jgi:hypothetical protein
MDTQSIRVGNEILNAGADQLRASGGTVSWERLSLKFLCLGSCLSSVFIDNYARSLSSLQSTEDGAVALRERVAQEMHKEAAGIVKIGGEAAAMARVLGGDEEADALAEIAGQLRGDLEEDSIISCEDSSELIVIALRNYVFAADALQTLHFQDGEAEVNSFVSPVLEVVGAAVQAASLVRADEQNV